MQYKFKTYSNFAGVVSFCLLVELHFSFSFFFLCFMNGSFKIFSDLNFFSSQNNLTFLVKACDRDLDRYHFRTLPLLAAKIGCNAKFSTF